MEYLSHPSKNVQSHCQLLMYIIYSNMPLYHLRIIDYLVSNDMSATTINFNTLMNSSCNPRTTHVGDCGC